MKPIYANAAGALALTFAIAACVPAPDSTPAPTPTPAATAPAPTPAPSPAAPTFDNWIDAPQTSGSWTYRATNTGSIALFGEPQQGTRFSIECNRQARSVILTRASGSDSSTAMIIRTETVDRTLAVQSGSNSVSANLSASDPLLDAMALTRGRFAVEMPGTSALYLPNWAEVTRVIEDCR
ncbi:hypothetical protein [Qipengyuania sp. RANM35]|uniref:hypothetical protein n=1 Tax=Qipengyuania sp. RANM35 TaxID=3068635 RepID=UPI0034DB568A